jgi:hypothetical protein
LREETAHFLKPLRERSGAAETIKIAITAYMGRPLYATGFQDPDASKHKIGSASSGAAFSPHIATLPMATLVGIIEWNML